MESPSPGIKTSEMHLVLAIIILAGANGTDYVNIPWEEFKWLVGVVMVYIGQRGFVKGGAAQRLIAVAMGSAKKSG